MKQVPYHDNPGNACALACYTMIAQYLTFHDPNHDGSGEYRHESIEHFKKALESTESPALARYSLKP